MTASDRVDRDLTQGLAALASASYPDYFDDALDRATARRQRPRWTFPERWLPMQVSAQRVGVPALLPPRRALALALIALLMAALAVAGLSASRRVPSPYGVAENGALVYSDGDDIYVRRSELAEPQPLIVGPHKDVGPQYSRDGTKLVFARLADDGSDQASVLVADADGSNVRTVLGPSDVWWSDWSPTGREVALLNTASGQRRLQIASIDGTTPVRTIDLGTFGVETVFWRPPAGDELIAAGTDDGHWSVVGIDPTSGAVRTIASGGIADATAASVSPDGRWAVVTVYDQINVGLQLVDLESGDVRPFGAALPALPPPRDPNATRTHAGFARWTPDGRRVVFGRYWDEHDGQINHQLWIGSIESDGANAVPIVDVHRSQSGHNPFAQAFSPDGSKLLVLVSDGPMLVAPTDGGPTTTLPWSPDDLPDWQRLAR